MKRLRMKKVSVKCTRQREMFHAYITSNDVKRFIGRPFISHSNTIFTRALKNEIDENVYNILLIFYIFRFFFTSIGVRMFCFKEYIH